MADLLRLSTDQPPPFVRPSEPDSRRFDLRVGRAELSSIPGGAAALLPELDAGRFDVIVLRYPARETALFAHLMGGPFHVIHADSLLYSEKSLDRWTTDEIGQFVSRTASEHDIEAVSGLVDATFEGYPSHYAANPLLSPVCIRAGYVEWAQSFISGENQELLLLSPDDDDEARAFAALQISPRGELVLAGVHPSWRSQGWYRRCYAAAEHRLSLLGCTSVWTSTQISNLASQRTWRARGYAPRFSFQTVHLVRRELWEPSVWPEPPQP